jgi:hypothetical protein
LRRVLAAGAVLLVLVAAPAAGAWTKLTGDTLQNIVDPSVLVLNKGTELIAYREPVAGNLKVIRGTPTKTLASGLPFVGDAQLLEVGDALGIYAGEGTGVVLYTSGDGGVTWNAPVSILGTRTGDVQAVAYAAGGPIFSQDGTGFINVYSGLGGAFTNAFPFCCGYAESLAVDSEGNAQIAFWSNATGQSGYLFGHFGAAVHVTAPGSVYQLEAGAFPNGSVDAVIKTGANLQDQRLLPGLTVKVTKTAARVLDDGFPVAGATVKGGGQTLKTNGAGTVSLAGVKRHARMAVAVAGYAPTSFRVP